MITKSKQELQPVVFKALKARVDILSPSIFWHSFLPFSSPLKHSLLLKLIELPHEFRTSEAISARARTRYKGILHDVEFMEVGRTLENRAYLVIAQENVLSLQSYIQIRRLAGEKIQETLLQKVLTFAAELQNHPQSHCICFSLDQIGITRDHRIVLTNYQLYFVNETKPNEGNLEHDIRYMIYRLLVPDQDKVYLPHIFQNVEFYGPQIQALVRKYFQNCSFKFSEITVGDSREEGDNVLETTITDSFHTSQNDIAKGISNSDLEEQLLPELRHKQIPNKKSRKSMFLVLLLVVMLLVIGGVTYKYLIPRPLDCMESEYLDSSQNMCLSCDPSCSSCDGGDSQQCLSCDQNKFLVKQTRGERVGKCSLSCFGMKLKNNVCILNPTSP